MLWKLNRTSIWERLLIGLLFVAAAGAFRAVFFSSLGRGNPYLVFYPAVMLAALYGGQLAGFVATLLATALCYIWVQQGNLSRLEELGLVIFFISCIIVSVVCESMHRFQTQASNQELQAEVANRKQVETKCTHLASIVESSDDAIIGKDLTGVITSWNAGAETILGYAASEIVGTSINRMIPLDRLDEEESIARKIQQGDKAAPFETMQLAKDGRPLEVSVTASPIRDAAGKIVGTSKVVRDIIAPKREEEKMRRMATVVKDSNDAITIQDFEGRITAWNRGAELMYGYGEAEALTTNIERLTTPGKVAEQKNFIRRHGGRAWAEGAVGQGATLHFQLGAEKN
jgi:PAS domain S-box-containing protein